MSIVSAPFTEGTKDSKSQKSPFVWISRKLRTSKVTNIKSYIRHKAIGNLNQWHRSAHWSSLLTAHQTIYVVISKRLLFIVAVCGVLWFSSIAVCQFGVVFVSSRFFRFVQLIESERVFLFLFFLFFLWFVYSVCVFSSILSFPHSSAQATYICSTSQFFTLGISERQNFHRSTIFSPFLFSVFFVHNSNARFHIQNVECWSAFKIRNV